MAEKKQEGQAESKRNVELRASTQALPFPPGTYVFSVRVATPKLESRAGNLPFPALLVASGPGVPPGAVEFSGQGNACSAWIYNAGDRLAVKIGAGGATLIISSIRVEAGDQAFDIQVDSIDPQAADGATAASKPIAPRAPSLKMQLGLHLRSVGDIQFVDADWAGRPGSGAWIEALSIAPLETLAPTDIEYKGLSANGFETPWLSDSAVCGTKGVGMPLVGFAVRLKGQAAAIYDCEYSAAFRSGVVVGPLRNGVPCRSKTASDPLDAVQIRIVKRIQAAASAIEKQEAKPAPVPASARKKGPSFSKFRDEDDAATEVPTKRVAKKPLAAVVPSKAAAKKVEPAVKPGTKRK